ncbi:MAG: hypothetical protein QOG84_2224 [Sphingomonadales bacterium]|jgi:hypothetical protein|nr:hypothetical protein [Sphingomonadales bacterium]
MISKTKRAALALLAASFALPVAGWAAPARRAVPAHRGAPAHGVAPAHRAGPVGRPAAAAASYLVHAQDPSTVVRALVGGGYSAKLGVDKVGDPMVTSAVGGTSFQIFFYNCTNHTGCATVQFHSGYDLNTSPGLETINEWNRSERFGRAYLDKENDPILEMDVDLDDGGLSPLLFIDNIEFWGTILGKFEQHIGIRK